MAAGITGDLRVIGKSGPMSIRSSVPLTTRFYGKKGTMLPFRNQRRLLAVRQSLINASTQERAPRRIGGIPVSLEALQVASRQVDAPELRTGSGSRFPEERYDAAVRRPRRALIKI